jgi:hypothetical protein
MTDKILQITANVIVANANTYTPKTASISTPTLVTGTSAYDKVTTNVDALSLNIQVNNMGEEVLPNPGLFKRAQDYYSIIERVSLGISIPKFDQLTGVSDVFSRTVSFARVFQESQITNDSYKVFVVGKGIAESVASTDTPEKSLSTVYADQANESDQVSIEPGKNFLENVLIGQEVVTKQPGKGVAETVATQDILTATATFDRVFVDLVDATDDFLGLANLDDDQVASVGKTLAHAFAVSDTQVLDSGILKLDAATSTDQTTADTGKVLAHSFTNTEQVFSSVGKGVLDNTTSSDQTAIETGKLLSDSTTNSETVSLQPDKGIADIVGYSEQIIYSTGKFLNTAFTAQDVIATQWTANSLLSDSATTAIQISFSANNQLLDSTTNTEQVILETTKVHADIFITSDVLSTTVAYSRDFTDLVDATDDFLGVANIDDDQIAAVDKNIVDSTSNSEQIAYSTTKTLLDTSIATDTFNTQWSADRALLDTTNTSNNDIATRSTDKILGSNYTAQDSALFASTKITAEIVTSTDLLTREVGFTRAYSDLYTVAEAVSLDTQKPVVDSTTSSDLVTTQIAFSRTPADITNTSEAVSIAVTPGIILDTTNTSEAVSIAVTPGIILDTFTNQDQIQNAPNKVVADITVSSDNITFDFTFGRFFTEISTTNDSGFINNQSYFEGSYTEPGYVGTNTNFS